MITFKDFCLVKGFLPRTRIEQEFNIAESEGSESIRSLFKTYTDLLVEKESSIDLFELWMLLSYKSWQTLEKIPSYSMVYIMLVLELNSICKNRLPLYEYKQYKALIS